MAFLLALSACAVLSGCASAPPLIVAHPDDLRADEAWAALKRGDVAAAERQAQAMDDRFFAERVRLDVVSACEGRAAALLAALRSDAPWLAARYDAHATVAVERLRRAMASGVVSPVARIELARRAEDPDGALAAARAAGDLSPGGVEAAALEVERLLARDEMAAAAERLDTLEGAAPRSARARLLRRWLQRLTGRREAMLEGILEDVHEGLAVPASLALLEDGLVGLPCAEREEEVAAVLRGAAIVGAPMLRARDRLLALLAARAGRLDAAVEILSGLAGRTPSEEAALRRWRLRLLPGPPAAAGHGGGEPPSLEERIEHEPHRVEGQALLARRLADEWALAARASYEEHAEGRPSDLDAFLARLDAAAAGLPGAPSLAALPRRRYGLYAELLDTAPLREALPDALLIAGRAFAHPAEIVWYDRISCRSVDLPDGLGAYEECLVRRQRVPGFVQSRGGAITGAGIDRTVYLDLDQIEFAAGGSGGPAEPAPSTLPRGTALPAEGPQSRRALLEPLDVAGRLAAAASRAAGLPLAELRLNALSAHERRHILDLQRFVRQGVGGQVLALLSAGVLPSTVWAEVERRAQLAALREARDPRVPLAQAVEHLPVTAAGWDEPHARGYARLLEDFIGALDSGAWPGARPLEALGIDRGRVLLQQLDRLDPDTIRAIALALPD